MKEFNIDIYTDGACSGNPGPMGIGVVLLCGKKKKEISLAMGNGTNNRAELLAIKIALEALKAPRFSNVILYTDSQYVYNILSKKCTPRKNLDIISSIENLINRLKSFKIEKVRAHNGDKFNELADSLARKSCKKRED